tara:strand:+ start:97483 stop:100425 length:2943 start_codon:yes stop_codon:yes gene_type:complete
MADTYRKVTFNLKRPCSEFEGTAKSDLPADQLNTQRTAEDPNRSPLEIVRYVKNWTNGGDNGYAEITASGDTFHAGPRVSVSGSDSGGNSAIIGGVFGNDPSVPDLPCGSTMTIDGDLSEYDENKDQDYERYGVYDLNLGDSPLTKTKTLFGRVLSTNAISQNASVYGSWDASANHDYVAKGALCAPLGNVLSWAGLPDDASEEQLASETGLSKGDTINGNPDWSANLESIGISLSVDATPGEFVGNKHNVELTWSYIQNTDDLTEKKINLANQLLANATFNPSVTVYETGSDSDVTDGVQRNIQITIPGPWYESATASEITIEDVRPRLYLNETAVTNWMVNKATGATLNPVIPVPDLADTGLRDYGEYIGDASTILSGVTFNASSTSHTLVDGNLVVDVTYNLSVDMSHSFSQALVYGDATTIPPLHKAGLDIVVDAKQLGEPGLPAHEIIENSYYISSLVSYYNMQHDATSCDCGTYYACGELVDGEDTCQCAEFWTKSPDEYPNISHAEGETKVAELSTCTENSTCYQDFKCEELTVYDELNLPTQIKKCEPTGELHTNEEEHQKLTECEENCVSPCEEECVDGELPPLPGIQDSGEDTRTCCPQTTYYEVTKHMYHFDCDQFAGELPSDVTTESPLTHPNLWKITNLGTDAGSSPSVHNYDDEVKFYLKVTPEETSTFDDGSSVLGEVLFDHCIYYTIGSTPLREDQLVIAPEPSWANGMDWQMLSVDSLKSWQNNTWDTHECGDYASCPKYKKCMEASEDVKSGSINTVSWGTWKTDCKEVLGSADDECDDLGQNNCQWSNKCKHGTSSLGCFPEPLPSGWTADDIVPLFGEGGCLQNCDQSCAPCTSEDSSSGQRLQSENSSEDFVCCPDKLWYEYKLTSADCNCPPSPIFIGPVGWEDSLSDFLQIFTDTNDPIYDLNRVCCYELHLVHEEEPLGVQIDDVSTYADNFVNQAPAGCCDDPHMCTFFGEKYDM